MCTEGNNQGLGITLFLPRSLYLGKCAFITQRGAEIRCFRGVRGTERAGSEREDEMKLTECVCERKRV